MGGIGGESLFERKKCVEKFHLENGENHSRGDGGAQSGGGDGCREGHNNACVHEFSFPSLPPSA